MTTSEPPCLPATKVMLLGSGSWAEVLIALQRLGVETIAVDRYDNAPRPARWPTTRAPSP